MVKGIEIFKQYFARYSDSYVIIGGTACDMIEERAGQNPRATKDIDIILIIEALTSEFVRRFWQFITDGKYEARQRGNGTSEYFRFMKPEADQFPYQIELSAILMNEEYYNFTLAHSHIADDIRIAATESLICLKAKAFLDLTVRKQGGERIDEKKIRKHFNDIFRLSVILPGDVSFNLPKELNNDLSEFCRRAKPALPDKNFFKAMGLGSIDAAQVFERICLVFNVEL
ncbi:MAG: hypothetical protein PHQ26_03515 [Bacteroidales bacterium]|nr:hypothetical protein [Bacteroidales bacterium]MDD4770535.1 hypothetical protein [Bacteroidales bacterium]